MWHPLLLRKPTCVGICNLSYIVSNNSLNCSSRTQYFLNDLYRPLQLVLEHLGAQDTRTRDKHLCMWGGESPFSESIKPDTIIWHSRAIPLILQSIGSIFLSSSSKLLIAFVLLKFQSRTAFVLPLFSSHSFILRLQHLTKGSLVRSFLPMCPAKYPRVLLACTCVCVCV